MTLEEAQAQIVELNEKVTELTNERDALSQNNADLTTQCNSLRELNQKYFNKLTAQYSHSEEEVQQEDTPQTCEEFAKTLTI